MNRRSRAQPKEPTLQDFGLSSEMLEQITHLLHRRRRLKERIRRWSYFLLFMASFALIYLLVLPSFEDNGLRIWWSFLPSIFVVGFVGRHVESFVLKFFFPNLDFVEGAEGLQQYRVEYSQYLVEKKEWERKRREKEERERLKKESYWRGLSGLEFEREICNLFNLKGYLVERTRATGDEGIDLFLNHRQIGVQCKATKSKASPGVVRDFFGSMHHAKVEHGIIISTGGFTSGCYDFAADKNIQLWDLDDLLRETQGRGIETER